MIASHVMGIFKFYDAPGSLFCPMICVQDSLVALKGGRIPPPGSMPTFEEIKETLGFNAYYEEEKRYATTRRSSPEGTSFPCSKPVKRQFPLSSVT